MPCTCVQRGLPMANDPAIWEHARKTNAALISKDEDFVDRWLMDPAPLSLLWIRRGTVRAAR